MNGRIFRLGGRRPDLDTAGGLGTGQAIAWDLAPGNDFKPDPGANGLFGDADDILAIGNDQVVTGSSTVSYKRGALAYVLGRNTTTGANNFEGPAQDVSAFVTFVKVN